MLQTPVSAAAETVLHEIEEKAGIILDEREEHERLVEGYSALDEKLKHSLSEKATLESKIEELKSFAWIFSRGYTKETFLYC
nr:nuclear-pore anchor [Ipomoea batatas]